MVYGGNLMNVINEDSRSTLLQNSKKGASYAPDNQFFGKNRYERRLHSKASKSVATYNELDMNKLFKEGILDVGIQVQGETDNYIVQIKFGGFLQELSRMLDTYQEFNLRVVSKALIAAFNREDVYIRCSCPDFYYRFSYWASVHDIITGQKQDIPSPITNPNDDKGSGCKHILLILANTSWMIKVSSVIHNYVNYMQKHYPKLYADVIYPAIYEKEYEEPVQLDIETKPDEYDLQSDKDVLDISNKWARTKDLFKKGNEQGVRFAPSSQIKKQFSFDSLMSDTE